ncbi:30S ribosomal protein S16 [Candidatus Falkowbacteria bacterium]|nr:30S ribosomal protein S16 [Candidatus Falkowbacteria bacterium]
MVKICLKRIGKTKNPSYRVIVLDKQKDPHGRYLENLGTYDPRTKIAKLNAEAIKSWMLKGAQPSATVHNLLVTNKIIDAPKKRVSKMSKRHREKLEAKKPAAAEAMAGKPTPTPPEAPQDKPIESATA